jgi:hypothetical protein
MDGETTTDISAAEEWTPNAECAGGDNCRCMTVYELAQESTDQSVAAAETARERAAVIHLAEAATALAAREVPAPVVNVAAPVVNVAAPEAPVVNVAAAEAPIVTVNVPKRRRVKRDTKFTTDKSGRIVGKTETETEE